MRRTPEPEELMDDVAQAKAYADTDFSDSNGLFVRLLKEILPSTVKGRALDLGCGPADLTLAVAKAFPELQIDAVDGADAMLDLAQKNLEQDEAGKRITLIQETLPSAYLEESAYSLVFSNSLLHHLHDPLDLWLTLQYCGKEEAYYMMMDLSRPTSEIAADCLVESYAMNESDQLRTDFRNSLLAAYTPDEITDQLEKVHLRRQIVEVVSDRHWAVRGQRKPR